MRPEFEAEVNPRVEGISYTKVGQPARCTKAQKCCPPGTDTCAALSADLWQLGSADRDGQAGAQAPCASGSQVCALGQVRHCAGCPGLGSRGSNGPCWVICATLCQLSWTGQRGVHLRWCMAEAERDAACAVAATSAV